MEDPNTTGFIENGNEDDMEINIDLNVPFGESNLVGNIEFTERLGNQPQLAQENQAGHQHNNNNNQQQQNGNQQNNANQFGTVRDRLFHAMLVRVALQYSSKVNLTARRFIETILLFTALILLSSLLFVHVTFKRSQTTCLNSLKPEMIKDGVIRVEVVKNLNILEEQEAYIKWYVKEKSTRVCKFNPRDVFIYGPRVIPAEIKAMGLSGNQNKIKLAATESSSRGLLSYFIPAPTVFLSTKKYEDKEELSESEDSFAYSDPYEKEANLAWRSHFVTKYHEEDNYEYLYRVEYALLYGVLRLPASFREKHGIPMTWIRIDSKSKCFGDLIYRKMMDWLVGYEDAIISSLRAKALNVTNDGEQSNMGFLHDLHTHEHYHFVTNVLGKSSYITAGILMLVFTFAISMLLRFSHHQIFIFIIDLLHMFELQQPLHFPIAPIFTVILALVGMEAIMSEVFNDTTTAFYVILIVWVADQYDAICCHSPISKQFWLRFFYVYQFFFYAYQYRFGGQYGSLALWTSAVFILHSMVYFFHHYEMPLILYQDRVQQVLADLHAPQSGMGTVEVQTITVAVHNRQPERATSETANESGDVPVVREPLSPSSVFDARGPSLQQPEEAPISEVVNEEAEPTIPEEIVAHEIVNSAMNQLFNTETE